MYRQEPFCARRVFRGAALGGEEGVKMSLGRWPRVGPRCVPGGVSGGRESAEGRCKKVTSGRESKMTQQGAVLQGYNNELVKCIEDLCMQKEELNKQIQQAEEEKNKLQHEIQVLSEQLECVCENLAQKVASRNELDKILAETEAAYMKILDSSRTLLNVLKKEVGSLKHSPDLKTNVT
ncbi:microtubule nucleation factor SSNA1-like isoform X1 [Malurus melanocephalus]|nr:microtubule nucleation factor SSNA1-like isoform X1 [Malurus melanocephalus]XP_057230150.1 microtubule nucleation factor SSNA1-like isoform X1 [Malurus melanocephalus]